MSESSMLTKVLKAAVSRGASDVHAKAGDVFRARVDGHLVPLTKQRLTPAQTRALAATFAELALDDPRLDALRDFDCSWGLAGIGRFRVNVLRQRSSFMVVLRVIPFSVPTPEGLGLPEAVTRLAESDSGLVLVIGPSGGGKTSTIAAMVHHVNRSTARHVVTLEDPTTWTRPWTVKVELSKQDGHANQIYDEPRCHEGNYSLRGMLAGARADEAAGR